jgi:hypothetical protein
VTDRDDVEALRGRVIKVWRRLSAVPTAFTHPGVEVVRRPASQVCPPGWVGIVRLERSALVVVPTGEQASQVATVVDGLDAEQVTDPGLLGERVRILESMGPASLAYADASTASLLLTAGVGRGAPGDPAVADLLHACGEADVRESGLDGVTSPMFVVRDAGRVVSAAGYRVWAGAFAHLSVLTVPDRRGEGIARRAASAAAAHALGSDLLLQWRAGPEGSRAVGRSLGFLELGTQFSLRLDGSRA